MFRTVLKSLAIGTAIVAAAPTFAATTVTSFAADGSNHLAVAGATTNFTFDTADTIGEATSKGFSATIVGVSGRTTVAPDGTTSAGASVIAPQPFDGNGYYAIGGLSLQGQSSLSLLGSQALSSISVFIGTLDFYNVINLLDADGNSIAEFDGVAMNNGEQPFRGAVVPANNRRVTFTGTGGTVYYGVRFSNLGDTQAFEIDNLSITAVPEPATWAMMLMGFAMVGASARYRRRKTGAVFA